MSTRRMTRETQVQYRQTMTGPWLPTASPEMADRLRVAGCEVRDAERMVTEWVEVVA